MNLEDESFLSAYLDGELDTPRRLMVETDLLAQPELAQRLQEMAAVRSLLGQLSRPTALHDVAARLEPELNALPLTRLRRLSHRPEVRRLRWVAAWTTAAAAAVLVFALPVGNLWQDVTPVVVQTQPPAAKIIVPIAPPNGAIDAEALANRLPETAANPTELLTHQIEPAPTEPAAERVHALLTRPDVSRCVVTVDDLTPERLAQFESAILETARYNPTVGALRLDPASRVDPDWPGPAVVLAFEMNGVEFRQLQADLAERLPGTALEPIPVPEPLVARLSTLDLNPLTGGRPISMLAERPPPSLTGDLRLATKDGRDAATHSPSTANDPATQADPSTAAELGSEVGPSAPPRVYLVWITTAWPTSHSPAK